MSCFIVEKGDAGLQVVKSIAKLGYKGVDTAELLFDNFPCPAANLVGGVEGRGFKHVMSGLEAGRINIAARAVGVAQAALEEAARGALGAAEPPAALASIAIRVDGARLLTYWAAGMKDRGERCDLEAGMAKLYASESAQEAAADAIRILGGPGQATSGVVERLYRDTPLMMIGEGTNEIQRTIIAKNLLQRHGERLGALTSLEAEPEERRQMALAVRQLVEREIAPAAVEDDRAGRFPSASLDKLAALGLFGAVIPQDMGGLNLDGRRLRAHRRGDRARLGDGRGRAQGPRGRGGSHPAPGLCRAAPAAPARARLGQAPRRDAEASSRAGGAGDRTRSAMPTASS